MNAEEIHTHIASEMEPCSGVFHIPEPHEIRAALDGVEDWDPVPEDEYISTDLRREVPPMFNYRYPVVMHDSHLWVYITPLDAGFHASYFKFRKENL